ncbi:MAG: hypothetical protein LBT33_07820 [Spirochaetia bacterium]|jgi:hypothetical protein|nr:hypothetical protein [Spirochaetia bacterium]
MTEEEIYSLIVTGEVSRAAALGVIRSYGNRKATEALIEARQSIPEADRLIAEVEIGERLDNCLRMLDRLTKDSIETVSQE